MVKTNYQNTVFAVAWIPEKAKSLIVMNEMFNSVGERFFTKQEKNCEKKY